MDTMHRKPKNISKKQAFIKKIRLAKRLRWTRPTCAALATSLICLCVVLVLGQQGKSSHIVNQECPIGYSEIMFRIIALASVSALLIGMVYVTIASIFVIKNQCQSKSRTWIRRSICCSVMAFFLAFLFSFADQKWGLKLSWAALSKLDTRVSAIAVFHMINSLAAVPTVFVVSAAGSLLYKEKMLSHRQRVDNLRQSMWNARLLLYVISICLIIAVVELYFVHRWTQSVATPVEYGAISQLKYATSVGLGIMYTAFLAGIFSPVLFYHHLDAEDLAKRAIPLGNHLDRNTWLVENGLKSNRNAAGSWVAVLGPLLSSLVLPAISAGLSIN